jgi:hypothetical protein
MSRKRKTAVVAIEPEIVAAPALVELPTLADIAESLAVEIDPEVAADNEKKGSVVKTTYKKKYAARAAEVGGGKVAQRSCWDWLAQELASECLIGTKISIDRFLAILDANGVDHSRWQNRAKGWEGRLRMTGRLALQKVVAAQGGLKTAEGAMLEAPAEWVAKFTN